MYQVTKIEIELMPIQDLFKARDAIEILYNLGIHEVDVDVRRLVQDLINKREQS